VLGPTSAPAALSATGPTGASDPLSAPIQPNTILGKFGTTAGFLQGSGGNSGQDQFNEQAVIKQLFAACLTTDLTNFGSLASALRHAYDSFAGASSQTPQITGVGAALNNLEGEKQQLNNLGNPADHKF
jgi:hypothetical protein